MVETGLGGCAGEFRDGESARRRGGAIRSV